MIKRVLAIISFLLAANLPALADYTIKDGGGANATFGSFALTGVQFPKHVMVDPTTGAAIGVSGAPLFVQVSNLPATQAVSGTVAVSGLPALAAGTNAIGSVIANLQVGGAAVATANPVPVVQAAVPAGGATSALQSTIAANQNVTVAGTSATNGQGVQGVTGGVPLATTIRSAGTNRSAAVTTTAANLMAANTARQGWKVKNDCAVSVWVSFDGAAAAAAGSGNIQVAAGGYLSSEPGFVETGALSAVAASGTCNLTAREY